MALATVRTWLRSAEPSSPGGVPTAMRMTRELRTAEPRSVDVLKSVVELVSVGVPEAMLPPASGEVLIPGWVPV